MDRASRAAIVGTGFMGWVHVEALRRIGVELVGIVGSNSQRAEEAATELNIDKAYGSFTDCLSDSDVDVVHLVTPNALHYPQVEAAIKAGKHVVCEKPLAMDSKQTKRLVGLARNFPQQRVCVNYNMRFYPLCIEVRERIRNGEMGQLRHVTGSYLQDWLSRQDDYNWRVDAKQGGELRAVADIGTHWIDLIQFITGDSIEAVCADLSTIFDTRLVPQGPTTTFQSGVGQTESRRKRVETEDCAALILRFASGAIGQLFVSQVCPGKKNALSFEIAGDQVCFGWESENPNHLRLGYRERPNEFMMRDPNLLSAAVKPYTSYPGGHNEGYDDTFKQCFHDFYRSLREGDRSDTELYATFRDGHHELLVCEAILASHKRRGWVNVPNNDYDA